ncbi:MAG: glutathione transferase GstA [Hyphomonadaceae bacterium]
MKLYYFPGACSLSPHIALHESGLAFEAVRVDPRTRTLPDGSDFYALQPLGYVPLLELADGTRLAEGPAIVQYIADQAPERGLAPPNATMARTRLQSWLNFVSTELHKGFTPMFSPAMPEETKQAFRDKLKPMLTWLDGQLAGQAYLMGETFTVADGYLFTVTMPYRAARAGVDLAAYANLRAFRERVGARSAVRAAMAAEGIG